MRRLRLLQREEGWEEALALLVGAKSLREEREAEGGGAVLLVLGLVASSSPGEQGGIAGGGRGGLGHGGAGGTAGWSRPVVECIVGRDNGSVYLGLNMSAGGGGGGVGLLMDNVTTLDTSAFSLIRGGNGGNVTSNGVPPLMDTVVSALQVCLCLPLQARC